MIERGWELAPEVAIRARAGTPEADALGDVFAAFEGPPAAAASAIATAPAGDRLRVSWRGVALFTCAADELAPALEASLLGWVARTRAGALPLHAAALRWGDGALLLVGDKGSGKSTLAAQLGAITDYLGDELALVDLDELTLAPFPKAATIKEGAFAVVPPARTWRDPVRGAVAYHTPPRIGRGPRPVGALVWPAFAPGRDATIDALAPEEAALRLVRGAFGGLDRDPRAIGAIARLAARPAFALAFPDTGGARAALEEALGPP